MFFFSFLFFSLGQFFLSISCMEELVKRTCEDFTKEVTPDVSATQPFVQRSQTGFQTLARARTMSLALGGLPSVLPQDKLAELKETAAKLCAPGRVW